MCARLVPMGWAVEIDAESGQHIEFGRQVLRQRQAAGWDAAVIMLGNNYGGDPQAYADVLTEIVDDLAPRPVVLLTVTEFRDGPCRGQLRRPRAGRAARQRAGGRVGRAHA